MKEAIKSLCAACQATGLPPQLVLRSKAGQVSADCPACRATVETRSSSVLASGGLCGCCVCGHPELYAQKDFPRWLGLCIVAIAALLAPFTFYLSLVAAALLDLILYWTRGELLICYACAAVHRGFVNDPRHPRFDREIAERLRYGAHAVMGKPMRPGGTANAPEPEH